MAKNKIDYSQFAVGKPKGNSKIDYSSFAFAKPSHKRKAEKRSKSSRFAPKTIKEIFERDSYRCAKCGSTGPLEEIPHHVIFRSQLGKGTKRNGVTICINCHREVHRSDQLRRWFEDWVELNLDENGNIES